MSSCHIICNTSPADSKQKAARPQSAGTAYKMAKHAMRLFCKVFEQREHICSTCQTATSPKIILQLPFCSKNKFVQSAKMRLVNKISRKCCLAPGTQICSIANHRQWSWHLFNSLGSTRELITREAGLSSAKMI